MMKYILILLIVALNQSYSIAQLPQVPASEWQQLFNGKDLTGWDVKIRGYNLNDNFANTFRVVDGKLVISYDGYSAYDEKFGHIFYNKNYSYYVVAVEYRFVGEQAKGGPDWAFRNNGIMVHGQTAQSMGKDQDFPVSVEVQLLGGRSDGTVRTTSNVCTPGTYIEMNGELRKEHCINSTSKTFDGDQWVRAEVRVLGDSLIQHYVNGELVLSYQKPQFGGGVVSGFDPKFKPDGQLISGGSISLQSESHPTEFRKVELLNLEGCMDPMALNYKNYYVHPDNQQCRYSKKVLRKMKGKNKKR
jgi:hypothetical protein